MLGALARLLVYSCRSYISVGLAGFQMDTPSVVYPIKSSEVAIAMRSGGLSLDHRSYALFFLFTLMVPVSTLSGGTRSLDDINLTTK